MVKFYLAFIGMTLTANVFCQSVNFSSTSFWSESSVKNLAAINTADEEFSPYIWSDYLVYIGVQKKGRGNKNTNPYFDIKASLIAEDFDKNFIFASGLNSIYHEGPISWDPNSNVLYFTRAHTENNEAILDPFGRHLLQIYMAVYSKGNWENIQKVGFCNNEDNFCHPAVNEEGNKMVFASTLDGGYGKMDLYISEKVNGLWGTPRNLQEIVNSNGNDWFPFLYGNNHLFYASDINDGNGMDIYYAKLDNDGVVQSKIKLPYPINSVKDDFGLIISKDKNKVFFSSNRSGGIGKDDLYEALFTNINFSKDNLVDNEKVTNRNPVLSNSDKSLQVVVKDRSKKVSLTDADLQVFVFEGSEATNFLEQLNNNPDLQLLEVLAKNTAENYEYVSDQNGSVQVELPKNKQIFFLVKKQGYVSDWNFIHTRQNIDKMIFELDKN